MAKHSKIEADQITVQGLFSVETQFHLPPFQRRYEWELRNVRRIFTDIDEILSGERTSKFLGTLVFEDTSSGLSTVPSRYLVVDGQQRLTTLYLALAALAVVAAKQKDPNLKALSEDIGRQYLLNQGRKHRNTTKILPTFQDITQFGKILASLPGESPVVPSAKSDGKDTMEIAYNAMLAYLRKHVRDDGPEVLEQILNILLGQLKFVEIILSDDDDPKNVFDSLNDTGIKLSNFDLVRNHVFGKYDTSDETQLRLAEAAFTTRWPAIEGRLVENPPKSDPSRYLFPFAIVHFPTTTKSRLFGDLVKRWEKMTPNETLDDLTAFVGPFLSVTYRVDPGLGLPTAVTDALESIIRLQPPASVNSFLMRVVRECADGNLAPANATRCLLFVESFLVRRGMLYIEPTGLHAVFKDMWRESAGGDPAVLLTKLTSNPGQPFPDDSQVRTAVRANDLYNRKSVVKHILFEYERHLMGAAKDKTVLPVLVDDSIEHVLPQTLGSGWPGVSAAEHKELLHTWGNLVVVSGGFNRSLGNKGWPDKKALLIKEASYRGARSVGTDYADWDASAIRKRADELVKFAVARWPRK